MRHYEIVFFRRYKTTGQYLIDWSCSYKPLTQRKTQFVMPSKSKIIDSFGYIKSKPI